MASSPTDAFDPTFNPLIIAANDVSLGAAPPLLVFSVTALNALTGHVRVHMPLESRCSGDGPVAFSAFSSTTESPLESIIPSCPHALVSAVDDALRPLVGAPHTNLLLVHLNPFAQVVDPSAPPPTSVPITAPAGALLTRTAPHVAPLMARRVVLPAAAGAADLSASGAAVIVAAAVQLRAYSLPHAAGDSADVAAGPAAAVVGAIFDIAAAVTAGGGAGWRGAVAVGTRSPAAARSANGAAANTSGVGRVDGVYVATSGDARSAVGWGHASGAAASNSTTTASGAVQALRGDARAAAAAAEDGIASVAAACAGGGWTRPSAPRGWELASVSPTGGHVVMRKGGAGSGVAVGVVALGGGRAASAVCDPDAPVVVVARVHKADTTKTDITWATVGVAIVAAILAAVAAAATTYAGARTHTRLLAISGAVEALAELRFDSAAVDTCVTNAADAPSPFIEVRAAESAVAHMCLHLVEYARFIPTSLLHAHDDATSDPGASADTFSGHYQAGHLPESATRAAPASHDCSVDHDMDAAECMFTEGGARADLGASYAGGDRSVLLRAMGPLGAHAAGYDVASPPAARHARDSARGVRDGDLGATQDERLARLMRTPVSTFAAGGTEPADGNTTGANSDANSHSGGSSSVSDAAPVADTSQAPPADAPSSPPYTTTPDAQSPTLVAADPVHTPRGAGAALTAYEMQLDSLLSPPMSASPDAQHVTTAIPTRPQSVAGARDGGRGGGVVRPRAFVVVPPKAAPAMVCDSPLLVPSATGAAGHAAAQGGTAAGGTGETLRPDGTTAGTGTAPDTCAQPRLRSDSFAAAPLAVQWAADRGSGERGSVEARGSTGDGDSAPARRSAGTPRASLYGAVRNMSLYAGAGSMRFGPGFADSALGGLAVGRGSLFGSGADMSEDPAAEQRTAHVIRALNLSRKIKGHADTFAAASKSFAPLRMRSCGMVVFVLRGLDATREFTTGYAPPSSANPAAMVGGKAHGSLGGGGGGVSTPTLSAAAGGARRDSRDPSARSISPRASKTSAPPSPSAVASASTATAAAFNASPRSAAPPSPSATVPLQALHSAFTAAVVAAITPRKGSVISVSYDTIVVGFNALSSCAEPAATAVSAAVAATLALMDLGVVVHAIVTAGRCATGPLGSDNVRTMAVVGPPVALVDALKDFARSLSPYVPAVVIDDVVNERTRYTYYSAPIERLDVSAVPLCSNRKPCHPMVILGQRPVQSDEEDAEWMYRLQSTTEVQKSSPLGSVALAAEALGTAFVRGNVRTTASAMEALESALASAEAISPGAATAAAGATGTPPANAHITLEFAIATARGMMDYITHAAVSPGQARLRRHGT